MEHNNKLLKRLEKPEGVVDVVLDTDTYNEIDDQYALAYLIRSEEKLHLQAVYAAPFFNRKSAGPGEGMEKSYEEILNVLDLMGRNDLKSRVYKGATEFLHSEEQPVKSAAAEDLVKRAKHYTAENPLYVIAIGAITNIASAILLDPEIINHITVIWLGGHAVGWTHNKEFNLLQDVAAARIVMGCGVPLVLLPCEGVVSEFRTTGPELKYHLRGKNKLCDYLIDVTEKEAMEYSGSVTWSRPIWDVAAVAWLLEGEFMDGYLMHSPIPEYDHHYSFDNRRHFIYYICKVHRDKLFADLFEKLAG